MKSHTQSFLGSIFDNFVYGLAYCEMIFDGQGKPVDILCIEVSKNFKKLTGLKDVVGKKAAEILPGLKDSNPELFEIYGRVALGGKAERFETYIKSLSKWFLVSVYSPKNKFFVVVFENITDWKKEEKDLENAKIAARNVIEDLQVEKEKIIGASAKDEAILASIGDGLIATDKNGRVILMNQACEEMIGWKKEEVIGKLWIEVVPMVDENGNSIPDDKRPIKQVILNKKSTTTTTTTTYCFVRKNKTVIPVSVTVTPIILDGKVAGAVGVYRDITREKEIDKAKSEFVSLASHQLRTPLGIMKWYLEALKDENYINKSPKLIKEYISEIYNSNERVLSLVRELLSVSRIDQGQVKDVPKLTDVIEVIKVTVKQMRILAVRKKIDLSFTAEDDKFPLTSIDTLRLREVIENLITNAIEYTGIGGSVRVSVKKSGDIFLIRVEDTGIGISKASQKRLFTKFFRSEEAIKLHPEGSGLGLYVVKSYVEAWGGKISMESTEGKGSKFTVSLPIKVGDSK